MIHPNNILTKFITFPELYLSIKDYIKDSTPPKKSIQVLSTFHPYSSYDNLYSALSFHVPVYLRNIFDNGNQDFIVPH